MVEDVSLPDLSTPADLLHGIASSAVASPAAAQVPGVFVVRDGPRPALAVLGEFDDAAEARVRGLFDQITHLLATWRYIDYARAEAACIELQQRLAERVPDEVLRAAQYVAIPRGGHIVLGMLATVAGLRAEQVGEMDDDPDRPVVVVDDGALTGNRFARWLAATTKRRVVFAPLCAPLELTWRIEQAETRVIACVTARELKDAGPAAPETDGPAGRRQVEGHRYWVGHPEHLVFAWKEPDRSLWNPVTDRLEPGWRTAPPALCLGNRIRAAPDDRVQRQRLGPGPLAAADHVVVGELDGEIIIGDPVRGEAVGLAGTAASIWRALVGNGTIEGAVQELLADLDVSAQRLTEDVGAFVQELCRRELLVVR